MNFGDNKMNNHKKLTTISFFALLIVLPVITSAKDDLILLKSGAFYNGCVNNCSTGEGDLSVKKCKSACGCMIDEINKEGLAKEYLFPFIKHSPDFAKKNQKILNICTKGY